MSETKAPQFNRIEGDCLDVMPKMPKYQFDLMITDPPYAMPATFYVGRHNYRRWSDTSIMMGWWREVMKRAFPLLKANSMVAIFANAGAISAFWPILYEVTTNMQLVVWDKMSHGLGTPFMNQVEYVMVSSVGKSYRPKGEALANIIRVPRVPPPRRVHPAQKPVELLTRLCRHICPPGGHVFDPFAGSFSVESACKALDLSCTSIDWGHAMNVDETTQDDLAIEQPPEIITQDELGIAIEEPAQ